MPEERAPIQVGLQFRFEYSRPGQRGMRVRDHRIIRRHLYRQRIAVYGECKLAVAPEPHSENAAAGRTHRMSDHGHLELKRIFEGENRSAIYTNLSPRQLQHP